MEAVPRLPMISFELKVSTDNVSFNSQLKQYIASFYNEDPEIYNTEISNLETLRNAAVRPTNDVSGCQLLKKYYCQLHFLKSRFPMAEQQQAAVYFSWKDPYSSMANSIPDIRFELMCILYNIGALHSQLGTSDSRINPDGMKMACTHFQCAAWAFQTIKENYYQMVSYLSSMEVVHFMQQVCLAQAQECILEKSIMDNRKATIIAKVAVQVVDYYRRALATLQASSDEGSFSDFVGSKTYKEWVKYLSFKVNYHKCISLLFQGQQAEEQQKMGERVAFYQAACEQLEEARKLATSLKQHKELTEALAFTTDVVEGKRKAAKNENEFIYHEEVPEKQILQEVKGASLVKGIPFSVNDVEVSGPDIFARLVPMEAHEASSLYSEKKAQMLRQIGELVEIKDQALAEFMSSMQLDVISQMRQATGLPQELVDRAAALSAKPQACQDLIGAMGKLSNSYHEVESMLNEINDLLKEEEQLEKEYQELMGKRPPSIIATDLSREAAKYREAHSKANDSNQNLHKAMTTHVANLKILMQPLVQLQHQIPAVELPNPNIDEGSIKELEMLMSKVEEMRTQRVMLWAQFREAVHKDDITSILVTRQPDQSLDQLFQQELQKHQQLAGYIEQNSVAQENIIKVFVDAYAHSSTSRRYLQDIITKRNSTISALITSFDTYEDLLAKANKGIEFYSKLETNVSKLLQRIKSTCKVQQEEREQILSKNCVQPKEEPINTTPKLKDYLDTRKKLPANVEYPTQYPTANLQDPQMWPTGARPAPLGSEVTDTSFTKIQEQNAKFPGNDDVDQSLLNRFSGLRMGGKNAAYYQQQQNGAFTTTTNSYQPISSVAYQYSQNYYEQPTKYLSGDQNYTNIEYATSVHPNASHSVYSSTYSSPTVDIKSSNSSIASYMSSGVDKHQNYNSTSTGSYPSFQNYSQTSASNYLPSQIYQAGSRTEEPAYHSISGTQINRPNNYQAYPENSSYQTYLPSVSGTQSYQSASVSGTQSYSVNISGAYQPSVSGTQTYPANVADIYQPIVSGAQSFNANAPGAQSYSANAGGAYQSSVIGAQTYPANAADTFYPSVSGTQSYPANAGGAYQSSVSGTNYQTPTVSGIQPYPTNVNQVYPASATYQTPTYQSDGMQSYPADVVGTYQPTSGTESYPAYQIYQPNASGPQLPQSSVSQTFTNVSNVNGSQNYQSNTQTYPTNSTQMYQSNLPTDQNYQAAQYSGVYTQGTYDYSGYYGTMSTPQPNISTPQPSQTPVPVATKESNIDLLTGLDFTINQAPLIPQDSSAQLKVEPKTSQPVIETKPKTPTKSQEKQKEEEEEVQIPVISRKSLNNPEVKELFTQEIDKFEKVIEVFINKTLSGPTNLELKWKEIQDKQDSDGIKKAISVARCYPGKNRCPDTLPYDSTRVELSSTKDDYINASFIKNVTLHSPQFIVTQAPLTATFTDFWTMIKEQKVELIVCLLNPNEVTEPYWPLEKAKELHLSNMVISLLSENSKSCWIERLISISQPEKRDSRVVMHLQFTSWPGSLFPSTPEHFISFTKELIFLYYQQRNPAHPIVVHCLSGIGRSGLFTLLVITILEVTNNASLIPDLVAIASKLTGLRKNVLRDREHLKFAYEAFLWYMKQVVGGQVKSDTKLVEVKVEDIKESDPLSELDPLWASKRAS